jgi:hypothetical protein
MTEIFFTFVVTSGVGLILACIRIIYKSKCRSISLCNGFVQVERDTIIEEHIDEVQLARDRMNDAENTCMIESIFGEEDLV